MPSALGGTIDGRRLPSEACRCCGVACLAAIFGCGLPYGDGGTRPSMALATRRGNPESRVRDDCRDRRDDRPRSAGARDRRHLPIEKAYEVRRVELNLEPAAPA